MYEDDMQDLIHIFIKGTIIHVFSRYRRICVVNLGLTEEDRVNIGKLAYDQKLIFI